MRKGVCDAIFHILSIPRQDYSNFFLTLALRFWQEYPCVNKSSEVDNPIEHERGKLAERVAHRGVNAHHGEGHEPGDRYHDSHYFSTDLKHKNRLQNALLTM